MRLQYRTIKVPPDTGTGRVTLKQAEQAVRALQQEEALKLSKSKLQKRGPNAGSRIKRKAAVKRTRAGGNG